MKEIQLTQGKVALVDDDDYEWLNQWKWCAFHAYGDNYYAARGIKLLGKTTTIMMHRVILGLTDPSVYVDHIDGDGLNNKRVNIRTATNKENSRNRGPKCGKEYKGVFWHKSRKKWGATIVVDRRTHNLGRFNSKHDAAKAYNEAAIKYHGEFAWLNPITD